ncbi:hypothetical protein K439DRAFT_210922 [Ramaria rubella]|nr:hypothetical protein K439DRAFT_210922 [Ramaria rubella]
MNSISSLSTPLSFVGGVRAAKVPLTGPARRQSLTGLVLSESPSPPFVCTLRARGDAPSVFSLHVVSLPSAFEPPDHLTSADTRTVVFSSDMPQSIPDCHSVGGAPWLYCLWCFRSFHH